MQKITSVWIFVFCLLFGFSNFAFADPSELYIYNGINAGDMTGNGVACLSRFGNSSKTSDLVIGEPGVAARGRVRVFLGSNGTTALANIPGIITSSEFGYSVAAVGDIDGDLTSDFIVGEPGSDFASIVFGPDASNQVNVFSTLAGAGSRFGHSVAGLFSDANGDTKNDVLVGAPLHVSSIDASAGLVSIIDGVTGIPIREIEGFAANDRFGYSISSIQDADSDTIRDILVGAPGSAAGTGTVYIYSSVTSGQLAAISSPLAGVVGFGTSVAVIPDINADGRDDILVGAPASTVSGAGSGSAFLISGSTHTVLCSMSGGPGDNFGTSVVAVGDQDRDGKEDFAVGATGAAGNAGTISIFTYNGSTGQCPLLYTLAGKSVGENLGVSLTGISGGVQRCDANGDGIPDFGAGAKDPGGTGAQAGLAIFYAGSRITPTPTVTPTPTPTLTRTPTPTPTGTPSVSLPTSSKFTYRISTNGTFEATNVLNRDPNGHCRLTLYGRHTKSDLQGRGQILTIESHKKAEKITTFGGIGLKKPRPEALGRPYVYHMIVKNVCDTQTFYSNVYARRLTCGQKPPVNIQDWEDSLPAKVN